MTAQLTAEQEAAARQCWRTPPELWEGIKRYWNPQIDIAADSTNHLCGSWCGPDHPNPYLRDGLAQKYSQSEVAVYSPLYCNPGFSNLGPWCAHVRRETWEGFPLGIVMAMVATSTEWWNEWAMQADEIILLTPRVPFIPPAGINPSSNSHDNCLLLYRYGPPVRSASPRFSTWQWCVPRRKRGKVGA